MKSSAESAVMMVVGFLRAGPAIPLKNRERDGIDDA